MKIVIALLLSLVAVSCTSGLPNGAVVGCGDFSYIGTFTKSEARGKALWTSSDEIAKNLDTDSTIALADALGCSE